MTFAISPGVYPRIEDFSDRGAPFSPSIGAMAFASNRGSLGLRYITDKLNFTNEYGTPDPTVGYGHYSGIAFLVNSKALWGRRVPGEGATYALGVYTNDVYFAPSSQTPIFESTTFTAIETGSMVDYTQLNRSVQDIVFDDALITGNTLNLLVNGVAIAPVNFTTDNNTTLQLLAQAIQNTMDSANPGSEAVTVARLSPNNADGRIIRIIGAQGYDLAFTNVTITGGASQANAYVRAADWLFFTIQENPGNWGDNTASRIVSVDTGTPQRVIINFSRALVTGNTLQATINGNIINTPFDATNNQTLIDFAVTLQTAFVGSTVTVLNLNQGPTANRQVQIIAPNANTSILITQIQVTGGATQPLITYTTTQNSIAPTNKFGFQIFEGKTLGSPNEFRTCTLDQFQDGFGNQLQIDYQMNEGPNFSKYFRTVTNPDLTENFFPSSTTQIRLSDGYGFQQGGLNGAAPTDADMVFAWNDFASPDTVQIRILINAGYSTPAVQQNMVAICEARNDCFAVLDIPSNAQSSAASVNYRQNVMNINSKFGAVYTPDIQIFDPYTGTRIFVPPSGYVASQYAYTDYNTELWFAPAGLQRGLIKNAQSLRVVYDEGDRDLMSVAQVNPIRVLNGSFPIWGEYTLQVQTSALQSVPVVRLLTYIEVVTTNAAQFYVFDPNDPITRNRMVSLINDILQPIKHGRGLYDYLVICDDSNNPPNIIDLRELIVDIYLKPTLAALYIQINSIVTKTSSSFTEIIQLRQAGG